VVSVIEHDMTPDPDGWVRLGIHSPTMQLEIAYEHTLNRFTQWQQFGASDYVLGLEPGNVGVQGRVIERTAGTLPTLEPGETRVFKLEISLKSAVKSFN
jgi:Domain of unknown function (DUF4432)